MNDASLPRILAVEDNPETQLLLQHLLKTSFDVVIATGIDGALDAADTDRFDVLLLDINLSEERTGIDLLKLLRERDGSAEAPAIALTAYAMPGDRENFLEAGFDGYISKPFTRDDLMSIVQSVIASSDQEQ